MYVINLFSPEFNSFYSRYGSDIAKGELFVKSEELWPVNTDVALQFTLVHDDLIFLALPGKVVEVVGDEEDPVGMRISLGEKPDNVRHYVVELVKWQMKNDLKKMYIT